jgi:uncharacterized protein YjgD (DUF1641 family)
MTDSQRDQTTEEELSQELKRVIAENPEALAGFIRRLDLTNELLDVASLGKEAMNDEMVSSIVGTATRLGELADSASDPKTVKNLDRLLSGLREASEPENRPGSTGTLAMLGQLNDPDVRRGLGFLLGLAKSLGKSLEE